MSKIAVLQYQLEQITWVEYQNKISDLVITAKKQEADIILLPEYAGIEVCLKPVNDAILFLALQEFVPEYINFFNMLAKKYQVYIQPGTIPIQSEAGVFYNRAYFFSPQQVPFFQDKLNLTEFEKESKLFACGREQVLFDTSIGKIGIVICYDSEFPEIVRRLTLAGALLILVPSYMNSYAAYYRVRQVCRARAIENQCYVTMSCVIGEVPSENNTSEETVGNAALFSPADIYFPDNGIIKEGILNKAEMLIADFDIEKLHDVRSKGKTRNFADFKNNSLSEIPLTVCEF